MLGFLPNPGDGELVYSLVARYGALIGRSDGRALVRELFGLTSNVTAIDLPAGLATFASRSRQVIDAATLIQSHTLFPYHYRFAPRNHAESAREWLLFGRGGRLQRVGVTGSAFPMPRHLMICPTCVAADRDASVSAWRREHQLPGVLVCPHHGTPLYASAVARGQMRGRHAFVPLTSDVLREAVPRSVNKRDGSHLLAFARGSARLLDAPQAGYDGLEFQQRLRDLLHEYRWSRAPSLIASSALASMFSRHPRVNALLAAMEVQLTDSQVVTVLNRLLYREKEAKHPLLVLMLLEIARASLDDLLNQALPTRAPKPRPIAIRTRPATVTGLPCGNPSCDRHTGLVTPRMIACEAAESVRARCEACGFTYRWMPDRPQSISVIEVCPSWDALLVTLMSDPTVSARAAARALGMSPPTIMRHARRLRLWRPEWKDQPKMRLRLAAKPDRLLAEHQATWKAYRMSGETMPVKQLPRPVFNAYRYLMNHARDWLMKAAPFNGTRNRRRRVKPWPPLS